MANKPNGNLTGIKSAMLDRLKSLYDFKQGLDEFASFELLSELCACSGEINREISVYISRDGSIVDVSVGDSAKVSMPSMRLVRNEDRLCGVRCIHTHPSGDGRLSGVDLGTLRSMKLDCMAAVGVSNGKPTQLYAAYLGDFDEDTGSRAALVYGPMRPYKLPQKALIAEIFNSDDRFRSTTKEVEAVEQERAVLVGMDNDEGYDTLEELNELAKTAGALVVGKVRVRRRTIQPMSEAAKPTSSALWAASLKRICSFLMMSFPQFSSARLRRPSERALLTEQRLYSIFLLPVQQAVRANYRWSLRKCATVFPALSGRGRFSRVWAAASERAAPAKRNLKSTEGG